MGSGGIPNAEECEKRYALERKLEQIMNLINA